MIPDIHTVFHVISRTFFMGNNKEIYITSTIDGPKTKIEETNRKSHSIEKNHELRNCPYPIWRLFYILSFP